LGKKKTWPGEGEDSFTRKRKGEGIRWEEACPHLELLSAFLMVEGEKP